MLPLFWRSSSAALLVASLLLPSVARADVFGNVTEANAQGYQLIYTLPIPNTAGYTGSTSPPYAVNNSLVKGAHQKFDRVAYYMELDNGSGLRYVYASMDKFKPGLTLRQIGMPHNTNNNVIHQQTVNNMNVYSNAAGIVTGTGIATGNLEMWAGNYSQGNAIGIPGANGGTYDFGDTYSAGGHGSFQVHNYGASQTLFAYNNWAGGNPSQNSELGIGNSPTGNPDWTFNQSAATYTTKNLQILARPIALEQAPANIVNNAAEASTFTVLYSLPVQSAAFNANQYAIDNSMAYADGSIERVAYYLELQSNAPGSPTQFAYVSMDPFSADASKLGVPKSDVFETNVSDMNVVSNVAGVVNGTGITTGNIEFWGTNYNGNANSGIGGSNGFDFDDTRDGGGTYGSMQIHNHGAGQTIIAYNNWGGGTGELGIGNRPTGERDWTFSSNSGTYTVKNIWVLADMAGETLTATPGNGSTINFGADSEINTPETITNAVTLENTGVTNSIIDVYDFTITGDDGALFDVPDFAETLLQAGYADMVAYDVSFAGGAPGNYSALLTFDTSAGQVSFNLAAGVVPEPTTIALWLVGAVALLAAVRRRKK